MKKIGILGGTFNPVHNAHLDMAKAAYKQLGLDYVLMMPTPNPPHKQNEVIADINKRCDMLKLAVADDDKLIFSDFELNRKGIVYSSDTIELFKKDNKNTQIYFIIGGDSLFGLGEWHKPEVLLENVILTTVFRKGSDYDAYYKEIDNVKKKYNCEISVIDMKYSDVSSTEIRTKVECGIDISTDVPKPVKEYIVNEKMYQNEQFDKVNLIKKDLQKLQDDYRYSHTLGVADTAYLIAKKYGYNLYDAYLAGLLHDCAKSVSDSEKIDICKQNCIEISSAEQANPFLLHAKVGELFAKEKYGIENNEILDAIRFHTTGNVDMSLLQKIIFVADYIEPGRSHAPNLNELRKLVYEDLDKTVYLILRDTLDYLNNHGRENIDEYTVRAYEYYKEKMEKEND